MQISVDIQWAHHYKVLCDNPNENFAVFYYWLLIKYRWRQAVCQTYLSPNQLLPKNIDDLFLLCGGDFRSCARQWNRSCFTDVHFWIWINANEYGTQNERLHILFFHNPPTRMLVFYFQFFYKLWRVLKKMALFSFPLFFVLGV